MKSSIKFGFFLLVFAVAIGLRLPQLQLRPMHTDEAVHAIKFGELLENHEYRYDPLEYHGPTLNYFSLIPAWICSASTIKQVDETMLRIIPVIFGLLTILLLLFLVNGLDWTTVIVATLLTAISPAMVFYSRYYIQEMLLVCFTFGTIVFGYRYLKTPSFKWAILTGISLGLMLATKETAIIAVGAGALTLILMQLFQLKYQFGFLKIADKIFPKAARPKKLQKSKPVRTYSRELSGRSVTISFFKELSNNWKYLLVIILSAIFISMLFYSSFFTNPHGIIDSLLTYKNYFMKAGQNNLHIHPWYYYFEILFYFKNSEGSFWSEGFILILAILGIILFFFRKTYLGNRNLVQFLIYYSVILTIIYSIIPYKTPWLMLSFYNGFIVLAAVGVTSLLKIIRKSKIKFLFGFVLIIGGIHLLWQSYRLNYKYYDDPVNPYVYSHPQGDVNKITQRLEKIAEVHPEGYEIFVQVIMPNDDYWPLPWYLRNFDHVGWWNYVDNKIPSAPVILASPSVENKLLSKLYELPPPGKKNLYVPLFEQYRELRPGVEIRGYVTSEIWNLLQLRDVDF